MSSLEESPAYSRPATIPNQIDADLARQLFEGQNLRDGLKEFEQKQSRIFENFLGGATVFAEEVADGLDERFVPRLDAMFKKTLNETGLRISTLTPDSLVLQTEVLMVDFESRFETTVEQFSKAREEFTNTETNLLAAVDQMDAIWANQDQTGIGGWRLVLRAVSAFVDEETQSAADPMERYRGEDVRDRRPSAPAIPGMFCRKCHVQEMRRLHRTTLVEEVLRLASLAPYRCHGCGKKSFRFHRAAEV
jgi:hypothetical protein